MENKRKEIKEKLFDAGLNYKRLEEITGFKNATLRSIFSAKKPATGWMKLVNFLIDKK